MFHTTVSFLILYTLNCIFGGIWPVLCWCAINQPKTNKCVFASLLSMKHPRAFSVDNLRPRQKSLSSISERMEANSSPLVEVFAETRFVQDEMSYWIGKMSLKHRAKMALKPTKQKQNDCNYWLSLNLLMLHKWFSCVMFRFYSSITALTTLTTKLIIWQL